MSKMNDVEQKEVFFDAFADLWKNDGLSEYNSIHSSINKLT